MAHRRGGKCLSHKYVNAHTKLKWCCAEGHIWEATPHNIKHKRWCPYCAGKVKLTIEEMQKIAESRGGKCLSQNYINAHTKLKWQCVKGHIWEARPCSIKRGSWCPKCAGTTRLTIQEMQKIAESRGGKCLSQNYINARTKLIWRCAEGHIWEAKPDHVKRGKWCPYCAGKTGEKICRKFFEAIFNANFPKTKPKWLLSNRGYGMELDGYSRKLKLAFEFQGEQHNKNARMFHKRRSLKQQIEDDATKRKLCKSKGVTLIEIPYVVEYKCLKQYIIERCAKENVNIPKMKSDIDYRLFNIYSPTKIEEMQKLAGSRRGKCLSKNYINAGTKLKWQCAERHIWEATPRNIKRGKWCPICAGKVKLTIEEMQKIAESRGGKCLSQNYINAHTKLKWQCVKGHIWEARPQDIKYKRWCPYCAGKVKLTIEEMQKIAESRGGKCLSTTYVNARTKLQWQCAKGHIWQATPGHIKCGEWCPICARNTRKRVKKS